MSSMKLRITSAFLWFFVGWYAGAFLAEFTGVSPVLGPIIGLATAVLLVGDPLRVIWSRRTGERTPAMDALPEPA